MADSLQDRSLQQKQVIRQLMLLGMALDGSEFDSVLQCVCQTGTCRLSKLLSCPASACRRKAIYTVNDYIHRCSSYPCTLRTKAHHKCCATCLHLRYV